MPELTENLENAIENLYGVFAKYTINKEVAGCPCCVSDADKKLLLSKPLRRLTGKEISKYALKALSTWGDENDFKHFLPRLFELIAENSLGVDFEIVFGKLSSANWFAWNAKEQQAIENYFFELAVFAIQANERDYLTSDYLCSIACAVENITPFLNLFLEPITTFSIKHLKYFVVDDEYGSRNSFLAARAEQRKQILAWLASEMTTAKLEKLFFENADFQQLPELTELIDALFTLKQQYQ